MAKDKDHLKMVEGSPNAWTRMPPLVKQIKEDALSVLLNYLDDLFSSCDDLFFDLSSRAASNSEQNLYFESMRELRVKKNGVLNRFRQNFEQCFLVLGNGGKSPFKGGAPQEPAGADALSLVQNDDLEQEVALTGMIGRARVNCQEALYHLSTRLDYMISKNKVTAENNPLDPQQICDSFSDACELLDINIKARIIIYKQFDRYVIAKLAKIYSSANELLINAGILPKITGTIRNPEAAAAAEHQAAPGTEPGTGVEEADAGVFHFNFSELSNLLASMRRLGLTELPNYSQYTANPGPVMTSTELLTLLSQLQSRPQYQRSNDDGAISLRQIVNTILSTQNAQEPQALQQPDEDVINLVAMFFDFVLDDHNLPVSIQALISRLQIPILKVALRDKSFFSSGNHPARKLVNAIAAASIGWDDSEQPAKDKLYDKIAGIVHAINEQYVDDPDVFARKLTELQEYTEREKRKSSLVEKRTSQSVEGQARTNLAKGIAQQTLFEKLEREQLPEIISHFLVEQWLQLLILTHLKHGEESPEWLDAVQLVDDLIWACHPHQDAKSRQRMDKIKPDLLNRISNGLARITNTAEDCINTVKAIDRTLTQLQNGQDIAQRPLSAAQAIALGHTPGGGSKSWKEMTALERQQARYKQLTYDYIKKAEQLPLGTWISYEDSQLGKIMRCKLAARIEASDTYVFVNRFGFKALEKSRKDFAYDMQQGRAVPLATGALFDRAMSSIVNNIRQVSRNEQPV